MYTVPLENNFFKSPFLLNEQEKRDPMFCISVFFLEYDLIKVRENLYKLRNAAFTSNAIYFSDPEDRKAIYWFFDYLERCLEGAFILNHSRERNVQLKEKGSSKIRH